MRGGASSKRHRGAPLSRHVYLHFEWVTQRSETKVSVFMIIKSGYRRHTLTKGRVLGSINDKPTYITLLDFVSVQTRLVVVEDELGVALFQLVPRIIDAIWNKATKTSFVIFVFDIELCIW